MTTAKMREITQFTCPKCGSHWFGSCLFQGEVVSRSCHGAKFYGSLRCDFTWPVEDDPLHFKGTGVFEPCEGIAQVS